MKDNKLFLDIEEEEISIGLLRLSRKIQDCELFFSINLLNSFKFSREKDFILKKGGRLYLFVQYQAYDEITKGTYSFIANKFYDTKIEEEAHYDLFSNLVEETYLLPEYTDVDYILLTKDILSDFSVILLPENLVFPIQEVSLSPERELYQTIQYYE
ncbi:IPExxxVDY family protein [Riemerella anatipestifer]|nr:IPExxxVDY family protein [Riemerella anatipestifer]